MAQHYPRLCAGNPREQQLRELLYDAPSGLRVPEIAERLCISTKQMQFWLYSFEAAGLAARVEGFGRGVWYAPQHRESAHKAVSEWKAEMYRRHQARNRDYKLRKRAASAPKRSGSPTRATACRYPWPADGDWQPTPQPYASVWDFARRAAA